MENINCVSGSAGSCGLHEDFIPIITCIIKNEQKLGKSKRVGKGNPPPEWENPKYPKSYHCPQFCIIWSLKDVSEFNFFFFKCISV